ncbi:MAG: hypothetical protein ACRDQH_13670 [Pseudonocardiaceae bacterium]
MRPHASTVETVRAVLALVALGLGILGLAADVYQGVSTVVVAVSFTGVTWALGRGLAR